MMNKKYNLASEKSVTFFKTRKSYFAPKKKKKENGGKLALLAFH